jgi:hypothetical protein
MRMLSAAYTEGPAGTLIPSDFYYQCLDGGFNSDQDQDWGEHTDGKDLPGGGPGVDLMAEVYVGRAPVENPAGMSHSPARSSSKSPMGWGTTPARPLPLPMTKTPFPPPIPGASGGKETAKGEAGGGGGQAESSSPAGLSIAVLGNAPWTPGGEGKPTFPVVPCYVALPPGQMVESVAVVPGAEEGVPGSHRLGHGQRPIPIQPGEKSEVPPDPAVYGW